ncbi:hypothetical protein [Cytobacillus oceanisediminis]|uniref:hypothetical protein n=1 Tax=Cytobacillus oceanisediminis TaxID=665099 RepID=UPI001FB47883|nr:hypothetical protein [Cytobacillus oceanisediminis]UOE58112.1 hypothetical protein IRB79_26760 [Cytobacillus oceanisediminis]
MAMGDTNGITLKLVSPGVLLNEFDDEVLIDFDTCDLCGERFIGTTHNNPDENPIELAISHCGC